MWEKQCKINAMVWPLKIQMLSLHANDLLIRDYAGTPRKIYTPVRYTRTAAAELIYPNYSINTLPNAAST